MIRKMLAAATALLTPALAAGQTWTVGPQPVVYNTHQLGDGSTPSGGTPPAALTAPAEIPTTGGNNGEIFTGAPTVATNTDPQSELKLRIWCNVSNQTDADPILARGSPKGPHPHTGIGINIDENTDYASSRANLTSHCAGRKFWTQPYWAPSLCKDVTTQWLCLLPDNALFYYARKRFELGTLTMLPPGTFFIHGKNQSPARLAQLAAEVPSGYVRDDTDGSAILCVDPAKAEQAVKTVDGGDSYDGLETPTHGDPWGGGCKAGMILEIRSNAPGCWDGVNRTSPNGRDQFRQMAYPVNNRAPEFGVCPDKWFKVPDLQVRFRYSLKRDAEYMLDGGLFFSSDRMGTDPTKWARRGTTPHADWGLGGDPDVWHTAMAKCLGIASPGYTPVGGDCGTYLLGDGRGLDYTGINTGAWRYRLKAKDRWFPVKPATKWTGHIHGQ